MQTIGGAGDGRGGATGRRDGFRAARPGLSRARYGRSSDRDGTPFRDRSASAPYRDRAAAPSRDRGAETYRDRGVSSRDRDRDRDRDGASVRDRETGFGRDRAAAPRGRDSAFSRERDARSRHGETAPRRDRDAASDRDAHGREGGPYGGQGVRERSETPFKGAAQPIRDADIFPAGYTDERDTTEVPDGVRLQKVLAGAGVASRRACEEMIGEGRVTVDGQVVRRFGARVDPARQIIRVDGKRIPTAPDLVYYAINKPIGVISTMSDPEGRPSLADYVVDLPKRLFHVGRLDTETEGLIILTNDGELAHRLTHPSYGVLKKYWAKVPGPIPRDLARRLKQGIELDDGLAKADDFKIVQEHARQALVEIVLHEGRKHIVRRMMEEAGHRVIDLARIEFGPVKLGRLKPGTIRSLTVTEVGDLYAAVGL